MGDGPRIATAGEAFVQYEHAGARLRIGRQVVTTPWLGPSDSRMLPQTFGGVVGRYSPVRGLKLTVLRTYSYKSRTSSGFYAENLYYRSERQGVALPGFTGVFPRGITLPKAPGTVAAGAAYSNGRADIHLWFYRYFDFADTVYVVGGYAFRKPGASWRPFVRLQFMRQSGRGFISRYEASLFGNGGAVNSSLLGLETGSKLYGTSLSISMDTLEHSPGAFGGGALISPYGAYQAMFAAHYSANLLKYGPGRVAQITASTRFLDRHLRLEVAALAFRTIFSGQSRTLYFDGIYRFGSWLKGLQMRERVAWDDGAKINRGHSLVYTRLMLQYQISR